MHTYMHTCIQHNLSIHNLLVLTLPHTTCSTPILHHLFSLSCFPHAIFTFLLLLVGRKLTCGVIRSFNFQLMGLPIHPHKATGQPIQPHIAAGHPSQHTKRPAGKFSHAQRPAGRRVWLQRRPAGRFSHTERLASRFSHAQRPAGRFSHTKRPATQNGRPAASAMRSGRPADSAMRDGQQAQAIQPNNPAGRPADSATRPNWPAGRFNHSIQPAGRPIQPLDPAGRPADAATRPRRPAGRFQISARIAPPLPCCLQYLKSGCSQLEYVFAGSKLQHVLKMNAQLPFLNTCVCLESWNFLVRPTMTQRSLRKKISLGQRRSSSKRRKAANPQRIQKRKDIWDIVWYDLLLYFNMFLNII